MPRGDEKPAKFEFVIDGQVGGFGSLLTYLITPHAILAPPPPSGAGWSE
jgi:hypothetical protein